MTLRETLTELNSAEFANLFDEYMLDVNFTPMQDDFICDEFAVRQNALYCGFPDDIINEMLDVVREVAKNPALEQLAKTIFRIIFLTPRFDYVCWSDEPLKRTLGDKAGPLLLAIGVAMAPHIRRVHRETGIPEDITHQTCYQLYIYYTNYWKATGKTGFFTSQLTWLHNYCYPDTPFVRIGRFEFNYYKNYYKYSVYRCKKTGELLKFAPPNVHFDARGFALADKEPEENIAFTSIFTVDKEKHTVTGNLVDNCGKTDDQTTTVNEKDVDLVLAPDMNVLIMHIPAGGGMTPALTEESFKKAKAFFTEYYKATPEKTPVAIITSSWIFNPNLGDFLPQTANLVAFQKQIHLMPHPCGTQAGLFFIYLQRGEIDFHNVPRNTSLQRAVADYVLGGGRWREGGMFKLFSEI